MLVTLQFKDNDALCACWLPELDFKLEDEELAVYRNGKLLGYYRGITGMPEEEFVKFVENYITERNIEVK